MASKNSQTRTGSRKVKDTRKIRYSDPRLVEGTEDEFTFNYYVTTDFQVNCLRVAMYNYIQSYAPHFVTFYRNSSPEVDENIAHRIGLLVTDNERLIRLLEAGVLVREKDRQENQAKFAENPDLLNKIGDDIYLPIAVEGPGYFSSDDIPNSPFLPSRIVPLKAGQQLIADIVLRPGVGSQHGKWQPICKFIPTRLPKELQGSKEADLPKGSDLPKGVEPYYECRVRTIGIYPIEKLLMDAVQIATKLEVA